MKSIAKQILSTSLSALLVFSTLCCDVNTIIKPEQTASFLASNQQLSDFPDKEYE